jgi:ankyrin repeat protein
MSHPISVFVPANYTSVHHVIDKIDEAMLRFLVEHDADLNLVAENYACTPVQAAVKQNNLAILTLLLELGADVNGPPGKEGGTVHYALSSGNESMVRFLLDNGVKISDSDPEHSVLCKALQPGLNHLLPVLLEKGAEVDQTRFAKTALGHSFENDDHDTMQLLLDHGASFANVGPEVLIEAVKNKPLNDVRQLLDHGMDPNCHTKWQTPLAVSCPEYIFWSSVLPMGSDDILL